jgi:cell division protein FtsZ
MPGLINLDFADVRSVMQEMGKAMMGTGEAEGDNRAIEAASKAIANPLLDGVSMKGAKGVIVSITGGEDMRLLEVDEAANHIRELVDEDANIIWGSAFNPDLEGKIRVSVVATGIEADSAAVAAAAAEPATRAFSFGRRAESVIPAAAAEPAPEAKAALEADAEPLDLETPVEAADTAAPEADADELVLGSEVAVDDVAVPAEYEAPAAAEAEAKETPGWLSPGEGAEEAPAISTGDEAEAPPAPRMKLGGTLFERMQSVARGGSRSEADEGESKDSLDIPRFLHRQNNQ